MYEDLDKFRDAIDSLKIKFMESGPKFSNRMELFQELQISLLSKASDYFSISNRKEQDLSLKRYQEKIQDLEKDKVAYRIEWS